MRAKIKNCLKEAIAKKLKDQKVDHNITREVEWCAEKLGVKVVTVWAWYTNYAQPSGLSVPRLCKLYKVKPEDFYYQI